MPDGYSYKSSGTNSQGNHYCARDYGSGAANSNSYHYSNSNGSYYYSNPNGSTYYNSGNGHSTYTPPSGKGGNQVREGGGVGAPSACRSPGGLVERSNDRRVLVPHKNEDDDRNPYSYRGVLMARRVGTGRVIPTKFTPPNANDTPNSLFTRAEEIPRFIRRTDASQFLIYADGACLGNGGSKARAGCSFVFRPSSVDPLVYGWTQFPLETEGPTGEEHPQTSNRAELRAVIAALRFRYWPGEGCRSLVITTDSEYVAKGITTWVQAWLQNGWKTSAGVPVKNQDLWKCLLGEVEWWHDNGMAVRFWRIPREWNAEADKYAKEAAAEARPRVFTDMNGALV